MKEEYGCSTNLPACLLLLLRFAAFVCLSLCVQTISAQSKCLKDSNGVLLCDLSISLIEEVSMTNTDAVSERAWQPTLAERDNIDGQLQDLAEVWCEVTLGKSRIRSISVLRGYKKSSSDIALYKNEGRSYSYVGTFAGMKPSIVAYYGSYSRFRSYDQFLGRVLAHELSHASLKVYDEYREPGKTSSRACSDPLQSDDPRLTIMDDHRYYTRYSHPDDYAGTPPPSTAQYRCYGESAWEVLLQPERCDKNLSLRINSWFPRQDYFAESSSCSLASIPSIDTLVNSKEEPAVQECIDTTRQNLNPNFLSGSENIVIVIDSGIDATSKKIIKNEMIRILYLLVKGADIDNILAGNSDIDQEAMEKRLSLIDFNDSTLYGLKEVRKNAESLQQRLAAILENDPQNRKSIDESLNSVKAIFADNPELISNDYNAAIVISDSRTIPSDSVLSFFKEKNIPIDAIAIDDKFNPGLKKLPDETGGKYYTIAPENNREAFSYAVNDRLPTSYRLDSGNLESITLHDSSTRRYVQIEEGALFADFSLLFNVSSRLDRFIVTPPGDAMDLGHSSGVENFISNHDFNNPTPGRWEIFIEGDGTFDYSYGVFYPVSMDVNAGTEILPRAAMDTVVRYPAPLPIRARIHGRMPALYAHVIAQVMVPDDASVIRMALLDDGFSPDFRARDGVYTGIVTDHYKYGDGIYKIKVTASNPNGEVVFDDTGIATFGADPSEVPHPAPPFELVSYHQVEVRGVPSITSSDPAPRPIRTDSTLNWGMIERDGHTNWYRFSADRTGIHYVQTSNLLSNGDTEMATNLRLYEEPLDGRDISFLSENSAHKGTNVSHIAHALDEGKNYLVSVSHANNGTGLYGLTVNSENDLLSAHEITQSINNRGGGGGSIAGHLLLVLLLAVLAALYHRRKHHRQLH